MRKHSVLAGVGATILLLMSGCSTTGTEAEHDHGSHEHESTSQPAGASDTPNEADVSFARDMIPHHEQAIAVSDIILAKHGIDPRVAKLADQIKVAQAPEIETMRGWLTEWGAPQAPSGHAGHDMSGDMSGDKSMQMGMMTDQELKVLRQAQGVDASRLFLTGMIAHHEGAVRMAQTEIDSGKAESAVHLAHEIVDTQQREIDTMKQILGSL